VTTQLQLINIIIIIIIIIVVITGVMRTMEMIFLRAITGYGMVHHRCGHAISDELGI